MTQYRSLRELNKDELEEVKERLLVTVMDDDCEQIEREYDADYIDEEQLIAIFRIRKTQTVTYEDLELFYGDTDFVDDDFFCNMEKKEEEEEKREPLGFDDLVALALRLRVSQGFYGRLYRDLAEMPIEERERLDKIIKSWNCYDEIELIIRIES